VNTVLAETYEEKGEAPEWEKLFRRREPYKIGIVPAGAMVLTAGVDVQGDRLEYEVVGWGRDFENWSVEYVVLSGDPAKPEVWAQLWKAIARPYPWARHAGTELRIARTCVDSGGQSTQMVYSQIRRQDPARVLAIKGRDSYSQILGKPSSTDVTTRGRTQPRGLRVWPVGVSLAKSQLYSWFRMDPPGPGEPLPAAWSHWPEYGEQYFRGLCSEDMRVRTKRDGRIAFEWVQTYLRNEPLDCRVYAYAAAVSLHLDRYKGSEWDALEASLTPVTEPKPVAPPKKRELGPLDQRLGRRLGRRGQDDDD
jgi:phage terminase large subunit GpA-like protein